MTFPTLDAFNTYHAPVLNSPRYLCSAGPFPVITNVDLINQNLTFTNSYSWYDITRSRRLVKTVQRDPTRQQIYEALAQKYVDLMNKSLDTYTLNVNKGIKERLNSYVDPCYVDAGYVSPNYN